MASDWSKYEVELIVMDYFEMLHLEISSEKYSKTSNRNELLTKLNNRSPGSIEFKHQNISAVLVKYGLPYIIGYKPRHNYQAMLEETILSYLSTQEMLSKDFEKFVHDAPPITKDFYYSALLVRAPQKIPIQDYQFDHIRLRIPDYLKLEQQNSLLGTRGEDLILKYEKWRLINSGKDALSDKVEWISREQGDGAGFDILSKNVNGTNRYIEVKTTKLGDRVQIYFSRNEFDFSKRKSSDYYLYRVFNFYRDPKFFVKNGSFDSFCRVEPTAFI